MLCAIDCYAYNRLRECKKPTVSLQPAANTLVCLRVVFVAVYSHTLSYLHIPGLLFTLIIQSMVQ